MKKSPDEVVIQLRKLIKKIENAGALMETLEITRSQFRIIFPIIRDGKGYSMKELCEIGGDDKALVSRAVADLESKGFVERDKTEDSNERNYKIILSVKGKDFFVKQKKKAEQVSIKMMNGVTKEEIETFMHILDKLSRSSELTDKDEN